MYSYSYRYKKKGAVRSLALSQFLIYHFYNNISINRMIVTHLIVRLIADMAMKIYLTILLVLIFTLYLYHIPSYNFMI